MTDRSGIFAGDDPIKSVQLWLSDAEKTEINDPNAMALATVDAHGLPNTRMVLLKEITQDAFVFYTNYKSIKGEELDHNSKAAFVLHWKSLRRQVRVRGVVSKAEGLRADAYFDSRSPQSRVGAIASRQSQVIENRAVLEGWVAAARAEQGETPKRPAYWGGYRIKPLEIEFWADGESRLHDRFRWRRETLDAGWVVNRISP
ncbi:pyridoxine/pyridoxamine 5'-phosphate oxidase [Amylibacter marinus]|uniref:Pyridoxine/pyridoxamine 5'-phosphate oxidase n=1 Tax=Amylibacter marinus TaxID=1475483 RepID=A0ABQ5VS68_9RHOB|nr:pyridoxamine 5'-phosphate oxidase [Amylibacter marinus]GLQ33958.1 pyridoxine/pyridoxamine 5'-phosphate oxidase [Amylibacter marinus]